MAQSLHARIRRAGKRWMLPLPYSAVDAAFYEWLEQIKRIIPFLREPLTTGSVRYRLGQDINNSWCVVTIRMIDAVRATFAIAPLPENEAEAEALIEAFFNWHSDNLAEIDEVTNEGIRNARSRVGAPTDSVNDWARALYAQGHSIDDLLPEYARRRKAKDLTQARELLRKAVTVKRKK